MKKVIILNGSPRKNWNTYKMCESFANGVRESGNEHSVANMFFLPIGQVNLAQFLHNIVPVTLGNIVGALFLVFVLYIGCKKSFQK